MSEQALVETRAAGTALTLLRPIAKPTDLIAYHEEVTQLIQRALKKGVDYGEIPGTNKPSLWKAGAERINLAFGAVPVYEVVEKEIDHDREVRWTKQNRKRGTEDNGTSVGLYRYVVLCKLMQGDRLLGTGIGTCSTLESKYVDRPRDCENTAMKMAQKRAFVGVTLNAYGLSDRFTQDVEDHKDAPPVIHDADLDSEDLKAWLKEEGVPEQHWDEINKRMNGRPQTDARRVVEAVRRGNGPVIDAEASSQPAARPAATSSGGGVVFTGTEPERRLVMAQLKGLRVPEDKWSVVLDRMMNRPSGDIRAVVAEVTA